MATFAPISDPTANPLPAIAPLHLGKRLLRERTRLGIPIDEAALALQTDRHTLVALESGDAIPPRLSSRLRTYLTKLMAQEPGANAPVDADDDPVPDDCADDPVPDDCADDPPAPTSPPPPLEGFPAWVRAERKKRGWTHRALAERASVGFSTVSNLELGHFNASPTLRARRRLSVAWDKLQEAGSALAEYEVQHGG